MEVKLYSVASSGISSHLRAAIDERGLVIEGQEETIRAWVVDVDGTVVTIFFGSTRSTFDSLIEDGNAVVASIVWGDAG